MVHARTVVIFHRVVHRINALLIQQFAAAAVAATDSERRFGAKGFFQRRQKGGENVHQHAIAAGNDVADVLTDNGVEDDRRGAVAVGGVVDFADRRMRFFDGVDKRQHDLLDLQRFELCQQAVAQFFGSESGAV